jgi:hypothetical protein
MGNYVPERTTYRLNFTGTKYNGLVVEMRSMAIGEFLKVQQAQAEQDAEKAAEIFEVFGKCLVDWNVSRPDGTNVPASYEGVQEQDLDFLMAIMAAWVKAISGVSAPLESGSTSGLPSVAGLMSTETLSESRAS